jgi:serine/threonine-protein phosphatase PGAM5
VQGPTSIRLAATIVGCLLSWAAPGAGADQSNHSSARSFARTIYLVRHGAYASSANDDSPDGPGLLPLGIAQSRMIGARLRALPAGIKTLTTSTMTRARETAAVIHDSLPAVSMHESDLLRECTPPMRGGKKADDRTEVEQRACQETLDKAFAQYFSPAQNEEQGDVLVCHGNVIRYFVMKALGVDSKAWISMSLGHASLTVIQVTPTATFRVLSVGDVGHIPSNMQSGATAAVPQLILPKIVGGAPSVIQQFEAEKGLAECATTPKRVIGNVQPCVQLYVLAEKRVRVW